MVLASRDGPSGGGYTAAGKGFLFFLLIHITGHKHQKGDKVIAIIDNNGYVLAPVPVAPVNETDMVLLPRGLKALKQVAKETGLDLRGAYVNLDGGFDSRANRKCIFNAG